MRRAKSSVVTPFTVEIPASELPPSIVAHFPKRPRRNARFAVTVESALTKAEKLAALRRDIAEGLADSAAGKVSDAETVFARLKKRLPNVR